MTKHGEEVKKHVLFVQTDSSQYGRVYFASQRTKVSMSEIVRICIDRALNQVEIDITRYGVDNVQR